MDIHSDTTNTKHYNDFLSQVLPWEYRNALADWPAYRYISGPSHFVSLKIVPVAFSQIDASGSFRIAAATWSLLVR